MRIIRFIIFVSTILNTFSIVLAKDITVHNSSELLNVLRKPRDFASILLVPGEYRGGIYIHNISGQADTPITIRGTDPENPPIFSGGGSQAIHMADCSHIVLADISIRGYP